MHIAIQNVRRILLRHWLLPPLQLWAKQMTTTMAEAIVTLHHFGLWGVNPPEEN